MDFALVTSGDLDALNTVVGDLRLTSTGDLATASDAEKVMQRVRGRLLWVKGEWFADQRQGFPYREEIWGVKGPDLSRVRLLYRAAIESTPGVDSVNDIEVTLNRSTRRLAVRFKATTEEGYVFTSDDIGPFILEA